ncbi:MAG: 8-amino-7-oxononanoate synthase [Idiomarina sp.]|nr:8-amino-7-oxononanoate synthase [Idiomarina sp.]
MSTKPNWQATLSALHEQRKAQGLWRQPLALQAHELNFCSNDYLGLSQHPKVVAAYQTGLAAYGCGSGGSPLISGFHTPHQRLSERLADWLGRDAVLLTSSGYAANYAVAAGLSSLSPHYWFDKRNHASMYDAVKHNSGANQRLARFRHNDTAHLTQQLARQQQILAAPQASTTVIASEGVFSMDGDVAPMRDLVALKQTQANALLWVDDAHGLGVMGDDGAGVCGQFNAQQVEVVTATFGKAFGLHGAMVVGSHELIASCWQHARHFIYSTGFGPAQACAIEQAMQVIRDEPEWRRQLKLNIDYFKQGLLQLGWRSSSENAGLNHAIQPIQIGDIATTQRISMQLANAQIRCVPIRPPTVPATQTGLRVTLSARHSRGDLDRFLDTLGTPQQWEL